MNRLSRGLLARMLLVIILTNALFPAHIGAVETRFACGGVPSKDLVSSITGAGTDKELGPCAWGPCDDPDMRDGYIPDGGTPVKYIRLHFHILRDDEGNDPVMSRQQIDQIVVDMNDAYLPWGFQFTYDWRYANSSQYRHVEGWTEFADVKELFALDYLTHCNIFIAYLTVDGGNHSWAIYIQDSRAPTAQGGIILNPSNMGDDVDFVPAHEMGHALGLLHTFTGVSEIPPCTECSELAGAADRDHSGDFCSDTEPAPRSFGCSLPTGVDACTGTPWIDQTADNYMSYSMDCPGAFTPQQAGRMHCWVEARMPDWYTYATFDAIGTNDTFGPIGLTYTFAGLSSYEADGWYWTFGDGGTSRDSSTTHTYDSPGLYDVSVVADVGGGLIGDTKREYVWVYGDTISVETVGVRVGEPIEIEVRMRNYVPIQKMMIPIAWAGPLDMTLEAISVTGLRTAYWPYAVIEAQQVADKTALIVLNGLSEHELQPGSGGIIRLHFSVPNGAPLDDNPVTITPYFGIQPLSITRRGTFIPSNTEGGVTLLDPNTSTPPSPRAPRLAQNAPNPFNPQTTIVFELPEPALVGLCVFDMAGRVVKRLLGGKSVAKGRHQIVWDGRDDAGRPVTSGTYFYRLQAGKAYETKRMTMVK